MSAYEPSVWRTPVPIGSVGVISTAHFSRVVIYGDEGGVDVLAELRALKKELATRDLERRVPRELAEHIISFN